MTFANLGLAVESSSVVAATPALEKMAAASRTAEAAARSLTQAEASSVPATNAAAAAARMHAVALQAQTTASRMAAIQQRNLIFQLNDVVVSAASGMSLQMIALQQGSQIFQNGIGNAFRSLGGLATSLVTKFAPVMAIVGALGVGVAALTTEINRNEKQHVSWTDVVVASWQLASESIMSAFQPVITMIGGWWDAASPFIAEGINKTIGLFNFGVKAIGVVWSTLPGVIGESVWNVAQNTINGITWMIREAQTVINGLIVKVNAALGTTISEVALVKDINLGPNPLGGGIGDLTSGIAGAWDSAMSADYLAMIGDRARQVAAAGGVDDDKNKKAVKGVRDITDEFERLQSKVMTLRDVATGLFSDMGSVIAESFRKGGNVAMNILDGILGKVASVGESLMNAGLNSLLNAGLGALTSALTGSGAGFSYGPNVFSDPWGGMRANGGPVQAGKAYVVGEKRPELFVPSSNGTIMSSVPSGQNGSTINVTFNMPNSTRESVTELKQFISTGSFHAKVREVIDKPGRAN